MLYVFPNISDINLADPAFAEHYAEVVAEEEDGSDFEGEFYDEFLEYVGRFEARDA